MSVSTRSFRLVPLAIAGLILAILAFLSIGGPFYDRWKNEHAVQVGSLYVAGDGTISSNTGSYDKAAQAFRTGQAEGALVYGPYIALKAGRYAVSWLGTVQQASQPRFDISSVKGGVIAVDTPRLAPVTEVTRLHTVQFSLPQAAEEVEFRVFVTRTDALAIHAVELTALPPSPRQP